LRARSPGKGKALGRSDAGFDGTIWEAARFEIVVRVGVARSEQNGRLRAYLLKTRAKVRVGASPLAAIWGIGLAADHPETEHPQAWPGRNLLGLALMEARARIAAGEERAPVTAG